MNLFENEIVDQKTVNSDFFLEILLNPACILKPKYNTSGDIVNFIFEALNKKAADHLNKEKRFLIGTEFFGNLNDADEEALFSKLCNVINNGIIFYRKAYQGFPFRKYHKNIRIKAAKYEDGILLNWFDSSSSDRIARLSNDNLQLRDIELKQSVLLQQKEELNDFYKILGNTIPYGGWMADASGEIIHISPSFLELLGINKEKVFQKGWINFLPKNESQHIKKIWENSLKSKTTFNAEFEIKGKDGILHSIFSTAHPLLDNKGNVRYWVGIHLKNDEQKKTKKELDKLVDKLKQSNEQLQQFAYIASHDLQEPLRMVASFTQLLEKRYKDKLDEEGLEFISFAVDGAKRMKDLIDGLLSYSRVSTHGKEPEITDVQGLIDSILLNLDILIKETDAEIIYENLPLIYADKNQLFQLFQNLILNGIKYRSEEKPVIKITASHENSAWLFAVSDNGIGIEKKFFEKIFVIFQRLHSRDKYQGTGIGLAVCKRIVENMGGNIWVESEVNKGSTFYFTIPERIINVK
jgi:PAS domain S-box-containing protein